MSLSCNDCFRSIEPGATACACGWKVPPKLPHSTPERTYSSRMPAPRPPRCESVFMQECRAAWAKSLAFRMQRDFGKKVEEVVEEIGREPGVEG